MSSPRYGERKEGLEAREKGVNEVNENSALISPWSATTICLADEGTGADEFASNKKLRASERPAACDADSHPRNPVKRRGTTVAFKYTKLIRKPRTPR